MGYRRRREAAGYVPGDLWGVDEGGVWRASQTGDDSQQSSAQSTVVVRGFGSELKGTLSFDP